VIDMQTPYVQPALWRGLQLFAGMLWGKPAKPATAGATVRAAGDLVTWRAGARSRREDELERMRDDAPLT
jgi:hypothetical protein